MATTMTLSGVLATKHMFSLPLDYENPAGNKIEVFVRELVSTENKDENLPYLIFFQGGPGIEASRPESNSGWIKRALKEYRVLLLDQRGTGLSTPVNVESLKHLNPKEQANYLSFFRQDNIVRDAEAIRKILCPHDKWSILGQSYGGFCVLTYLSFFPEGLREAYITGGIPPIASKITADDVYRETYKRVLAKNEDFYSRFKDAGELTSKLAKHITEQEVILSTGERLTVEMLQLVGINLGMNGGPESIYYLLEHALIETPTGTQVNPYFLANFSKLHIYNTNPIYAILHESIYCQGQASNWSAHRTREEYPELNYKPGALLIFTGEMIYPWMFDQLVNLKPLKEAAEILAQKSDWPLLYDTAKLKNNQVPIAAVIYAEDMYLEAKFSLEVCEQVENFKHWLTSEYEHSALRTDGEKVLDRLIALNRGEVLR